MRPSHNRAFIMGETHHNTQKILSDSLRYGKRIIILLAVLLAWECNAQKVKSAKSNVSVCLPVEVLQSLITASVDSADELLSAYGYQYAPWVSGSDSVRYDTLDGVEVRYSIIYFNYKGDYASDEDYSARVELYVPIDDLHYNEVLFTAYNVKDLCKMRKLFMDNGYVQSSNRNEYMGSMSVDDNIVNIVATLNQDDEFLYVTFKEAEEKLQYVRQKIVQYSSYVDSILNSALNLANKKYQFNNALSMLESVKGFYPPKDNVVALNIKSIEDQRRGYYDNLLKGELEKGRYRRSKELLDTLLIITPEWDSSNISMYKKQKEGIESLLNKNTVRYSEIYPVEYDSICSQIQTLFNEDIRNHKYLGVEQKLRYSFHINTDTSNASNGTVSLKCNTQNSKYLQKNVGRQDSLQAAIDRIAHSSLIKVKKENGVPIMTDETFEGEITFDYAVLTRDADDAHNDSIITKFIYDVEMEYLSTKVKRGLDGDLRVIEDIVPRKPTMERFTFGLTRKSDGYRNYSDVLLLNFETAMGASWMPSLLVPGLGTYNQKARSSVSVRAVPFFLFAGISAASFMWDRHVTKNGLPQYEMTDPSAGNPLYIKNVGKWVGTVCLTISATIYVVELVEGIGNSIRNIKYTKNLRKRLLEEGPIPLRWEDVTIPAGVEIPEEGDTKEEKEYDEE